MENKTIKTIPVKPLVLRKRQAEWEIKKAINSASAVHRISFSDLEDILFKFYVEAQQGAEKEYRDAELTYNRQIAEYQKQKIEQEKEKEKEVTDNG